MKIGEIVNGYCIIEEVGHGGMGVVYKARKNGVDYALKTVKTAADQETKRRFCREVRMLSTINDDHVVEVIDCDIISDEPYYIMPFCKSSLKDEAPNFSMDKKIEECISLCQGVNALHKAGIYHRDIKPDNAMYFNGVLKVTDLGGGRMINRDTTTLTASDHVIFTAGYVPPEYLRDLGAFKKGTRQGDIYMIGKTLYYVMSNGGDVSNVDLSKVDAGIAPIIERCLKESLNDRYDNLDDIIRELQALQNARLQLQLAPKTYDEIIAQGVPAMYDDLYNLLLRESTDERNLFDLLQKLDQKTIVGLFTAKNHLLNQYIDTLDYLLRNPIGMIQFATVEVYVRTIQYLLPLCKSVYHQQKLLELAIDLSINYNRYPAMLIVGQILSNLKDNEARDLGILFVRRKEDIRRMMPNFTKPIHYIVRNLIR